MKEKLLSILGELEQYNLEDFYYSLTIDYKNIVEDFRYSKFNVCDIINKINEYNCFESYNLTVFNCGPYDESKYENYYFSAVLIFHGNKIDFIFSSPYLSNRYLEVISIDNLFKIYSEHKYCSKRLYDVIKTNI